MITRPSGIFSATVTFRSRALLAWVLIPLLCSACPGDYKAPTGQFPDVTVLIADEIPFAGTTTIGFSDPVDPAGLEVTLLDAGGEPALGTSITGERDVHGAIDEVSFTPAYGLTDGAAYTFRIKSKGVNFEKTVTATSAVAYRPGVYLTTFNGPGLEDISSEIRTWFTEYTEPDEEGRIEIWHIDADNVESEGGVDICLGWAVDPGKPAIGFATNGILQLDDEQQRMTTFEGGGITIDATVACICDGRYVDQAVPAGATISGRIEADGICFCNGLPSFANYATYFGRRCPEETVLPHPPATPDDCNCSLK